MDNKLAILNHTATYIAPFLIEFIGLDEDNAIKIYESNIFFHSYLIYSFFNSLFSSLLYPLKI